MSLLTVHQQYYVSKSPIRFRFLVNNNQLCISAYPTPFYGSTNGTDPSQNGKQFLYRSGGKKVGKKRRCPRN
jgi:hypothetical protein